MRKRFMAKFGMRSLGLVAMVIALPAYADEAMTVVQDIASKWQNAWNSGDAKGIADLYVADAIFGSGVLGTLKGRAEIEKAVADQIKKSPKITITPIAAYKNGNVIYAYWTSCSLRGRAAMVGPSTSTMGVCGILRCMFQT